METRVFDVSMLWQSLPALLEYLDVTLLVGISSICLGSLLGGLLAYPIAIAFMGVDAASVAFYAYIVPFLVSTVGGSIIAGALLFALEKNGALGKIQSRMG